MAARIVLSRHALDRMAERGVSLDEVQECIFGATICYVTGRGNEYRKVVNGRPLKMVTVPGRDNDVEKFVKTVIVEDDDAS